MSFKVRGITVTPESVSVIDGGKYSLSMRIKGWNEVTISAITLSGTDPVQITANHHGASTGDEQTLAGITELAGPDLNTAFGVTVINNNNFSLDGTNSSDYSGVYTSGGTTGDNTSTDTPRINRTVPVLVKSCVEGKTNQQLADEAENELQVKMQEIINKHNEERTKLHNSIVDGIASNLESNLIG